MTNISRNLPDDGEKSTGRTQRGQRDIGDLFAPFFRVAFSNIKKTDATSNIKKTDATAKNGEQTHAAQGVVNRLVASATFETTGKSLGVPEENSETLEIDSRLLPKTAAALKIESKSNAALKFTLTLTPPYEDGIRILNSRLITFGTLVKVQWGYTGWGSGADILSDIFVFRNNEPRAEFGDDISITVSGHDLTASIGSRSSSTRKWLFSDYPNDCAIVRKLVARSKVELDVSDVPATSNFLTGKNRKKSETGGGVPAAAIEQTIDDWAFIRRLCHDHGLSFTSQGTVFRIFSLFDASTATKYSYRLLWRRRPKDGRDIPLMNVRGNILPWTFLPAEGRGLAQFTFNSDNPSKSTIKTESPVTKKTPSLGAGGAAGDANGIPSDLRSMGGDGDGEEYVDKEAGTYITRPKPDKDENRPPLMSTPETAHNAEEKLENEVNKVQAFSHPMVGVTAPGVVDLWPGVTVMLEGTSEIFDGPYFVRDATHTINTSGYEMELVLLRHTIKGARGDIPQQNPVTPTDVGDKDESKNAIEEDNTPLADDLVD